MALLTMEEARDQLNAPHETSDMHINRLVEQASDVVLNYCGPDPVTEAARTWTDVTVPGTVKAAVLLVLTKLWTHRGDEPSEPDGFLSPDVVRLLERYKEPIVS
jgi:hypothetical protein